MQRTIMLLWVGLLIDVSLQAQARPIELGTDLSLSWYPDGGLFALAIPAAGAGFLSSTLPAPVTGVRVGFPLSNRVSVEPATSLSVLSTLDQTIVAWNLAARLLYHLRDGAARSRPYVGGMGTLTLLDVSRSVTQFGIGIEAGVKTLISDRVGWRFGGGYYHGFGNSDFGGRDVVYGLLGISVFLGGNAGG